MDYKKKRERLLQLYEKAKHNSGWKNPDGIASSDGRAKKSMQTIVAKGKRLERESEDFTDIPNKEESIPTLKESINYYSSCLKLYQESFNKTNSSSPRR